MRATLATLGLALGLALGIVLLVPTGSRARCAMSPGDELVLLTTRAQGGVVLLQRRATRGASAVLTGDTPGTLEVEREGCTRGCRASLTLASLAPNLYALRVPAGTAPGRWQITTPAAGGTFEVGAAATTSAPRTAPATSRIDPQMAGTGFFVPAIVLSTPAPADTVGVLARWPGSSFFMPAVGDRTRFALHPGRCRVPLPGFVRPEPRTVLELSFVDGEGRLSPTARVTLTDVSMR
jgi:hypothetical protein